MLVHKQYEAKCSGCHKTIDLFNYKGLDPDSRMGSHHCKQMCDVPDEQPLFYDEVEVSVNLQTRRA